MDFLDPKKHKAHTIRLIIGYILVAIALVLTTVILLYQANGFGLKNGEVIQNGLVFVSSRPGSADIFINGKKHNEVTNARLLMLAGQYTFELKRDGYRSWKRAINVEGGAVVRFDYPVLFPSKLTTTTVKRYDAQPPLATQSPDRRWLVIQTATAVGSFEVFDLNNPEEAAIPAALPANVIGLKDGLHRWKVQEWSTDNRHVLLQHSTEKNGNTASEFIVLDRANPAESINVNSTLGVNPSAIYLRDKKYDRFYLYSQTEKLVTTASLAEPTPKPFLKNILAFKPHGDDVILYATSQATPEGKATIKVLEGDQTYTIRQVAAADAYMLEIARYDGSWYVVAGSPAENRTYVYKNPTESLREKPKAPLVPVQVLKVPNAQYVAFSDNARFIMAQNGQQFAVYDAENDRGYAYQLEQPLDAPQPHVTWMDGHRLMAVSNGKTLVFDFDNANREVLVSASPAYQPFFDRDYEFLYTLAPQEVRTDSGQASTGYVLSSTALLTPEDQ